MARQFVTREARPVLLLECRGDFSIFAIELRVVLAHQALQLGELADHRRQQVALGDLCRALRGRGVMARDPRDLAGEGGDAGGLVGVTAELGLESDGAERLASRLQGRLAVSGEKEGGVGEARPHDALVAAANLVRIAACAGC